MTCRKCVSHEVVFEASQNMGHYCYNCGMRLRERLPWVRLRWLKEAKLVFTPQILGGIKALTRVNG